jgi:hypothetical protein
VKELHLRLALLLLLPSGCQEPLSPVEMIDGPRVLGARVEVNGEPERAAPTLGEAANVTFLLASPLVAQSSGFALSACAAGGARGKCESEPFARIVSADGELDAISLAFEVPTDLSTDHISIVGLVCPSGTPNAAASACDGPLPGTAVMLELPLLREGDVNYNPSIGEPSFDGGPWPDLPAREGDCAGLGYAEVTPGSEHELGVRLSERDRDQLLGESALAPSRESLQLSHFVTAGELPHAFQVLGWEAEELARTSAWRAPERAGLVQFWLVLRDYRGGSDFTQRAVCVRSD